MENTCVTPTITRTKIFGNNLPILKKCRGKFECLIYEMLVIEEKEPEMNTQSDSAIIAKLFSIYFLLSTARFPNSCPCR